jgi:hypothetical protein
MPRQTHTLAPTRSWANKERRGETLGFRHYWNNSPSQDWDRIAPGLRCPKKTTAPLLDPIHGWGRLASPSLPCRNLLPNLENPMVPPGPGPAGPAHAPQSQEQGITPSWTMDASTSPHGSRGGEVSSSSSLGMSPPRLFRLRSPSLNSLYLVEKVAVG